MDPQLLFALSRLSSRAGRARRIQRQVHVQSIRAARRFLRHVAHAYPQNVSQFLSTRETMAIHGNPFSARSFVNEKLTSADKAATKETFREEVLRGLSKSPRELPCKFSY